MMNMIIYYHDKLVNAKKKNMHIINVFQWGGKLNSFPYICWLFYSNKRIFLQKNWRIFYKSL